MPTCLCCSDTLLRQMYKGQVHWYCCRCRQLMPNVEHTRWSFTPLSAAIRQSSQYDTDWMLKEADV